MSGWIWSITILNRWKWVETIIASIVRFQHGIRVFIWSIAVISIKIQWPFTSASCACMRRSIHRNWHATCVPFIAMLFRAMAIQLLQQQQKMHWASQFRPMHRRWYHRCNMIKVHASQRANCAACTRPINPFWCNTFTLTIQMFKFSSVTSANIHTTSVIDSTGIIVIIQWTMSSANCANFKPFTVGIWNVICVIMLTPFQWAFDAESAILRRQRNKALRHMKLLIIVAWM